MAKLNFTNKAVEKIVPDAGKQTIYWDTQLRRLGLRVGQTTKAFICEKKQNGQSVRVTLGVYPEIDVPEARRRATKILATLSDGVNINQERRAERLRTLTLMELYRDYVKTKAGKLKASTLKQYDAAVYRGYPDWLELEVRSITKDMVEQRHLKLTRDLGESQANKFSGTLKALINFAMKKYEIDGQPLLGINPVNRLSEVSIWNPKRRKSTYLKPHHIKRLLEELQNNLMGDYLRFILLTGVRRREATTLTWNNVSLPDRSYFLPDVKNKNPIELPLSRQLIEVIERRQVERINDYVFPSLKSASGHIEEPKKAVIALGQRIGHHFTLHDLRRTFVTIAESLDVSQYAIKALVNHRMSFSGDVTSGYVILSLERLRGPMQLISDRIFKCTER